MHILSQEEHKEGQGLSVPTLKEFRVSWAHLKNNKTPKQQAHKGRQMTSAENQVPLQDVEKRENLRVWRTRVRSSFEQYLESWVGFWKKREKGAF